MKGRFIIVILKKDNFNGKINSRIQGLFSSLAEIRGELRFLTLTLLQLAEFKIAHARILPHV